MGIMTDKITQLQVIVAVNSKSLKIIEKYATITKATTTFAYFDRFEHC